MSYVYVDQGEPGNDFYFLEEGAASAVKLDNTGKEVEVY